MVASNPPPAEAAAEAKPNQDPPASSSPDHVEEKNRAADETSTQTPIPTTTTTATTEKGPSDKALEAGVAAEEKTAPQGGSTSKAREAEIAASAAALSGAEKKETGPSPRPSIQTDLDDELQEDFQGEVVTNDELPSAETIRRIENYIVLDRHGKTHTFRSLYTGRSVARRVLVIFVRHFFCGVSGPQIQGGALSPFWSAGWNSVLDG